MGGKRISISKDEAQILAECLSEQKHGLSILDYRHDNTVYTSLEKLQEKLTDFAKDGRRTGRASLDSFDDMLKRYARKVCSSTAKNI